MTWPILGSQFSWVYPMYTRGIHVIKHLFFSCSSTFYHKEGLGQELGRVKGKLFFLPYKGNICCQHPSWPSSSVQGSGGWRRPATRGNVWNEYTEAQVTMGASAPRRNELSLPLTGWRAGWCGLCPCLKRGPGGKIQVESQSQVRKGEYEFKKH